MDLIESTKEKCCCNCTHDIRIKDGQGMVTHCICEQDGSRIGYSQCFECMCNEWESN